MPPYAIITRSLPGQPRQGARAAVGRQRPLCTVPRCEPVGAPERPPVHDGSDVAATNENEGSCPAATVLSEIPEAADKARLAALQPDSQQQPEDERKTSLWEDVGPLLKFAIPTLCIAVTSPLMSLVDTSVVGLYSEVQLAAMSPATSVCDGIYYMMTFIPMAVTNLVSLHMARNNPGAAGMVVSQALAFSTCLCVTIAALLVFFSPNVFAAMGTLPTEMIHTASGYVSECRFFLACRAPSIPMTSTLAAAVINLFGDLLLCRVFSFGAVGAAIASSTANILVFFYLAYRIQQKLPEQSPYAGVRVHIAPAVPHAATVRTLVVLAGPILGVLALKVLLFMTIAVRAVGEGMAVSAGHRILFGHAMLLAIFGETICNAAQSFLPPLIGQPAAAWRLVRALSVCALSIGLFNATVGAGVAYATLPLFTTNPEVVAVATSAMPLLALQGLLHAVSMGTEGVLLAARDGWFLLASYGFAFLALQVLLDVTLGWGWGLRGCWAGSVGFMSLRLAMNAWRLLRPKTIISSTKVLSDNSGVLVKETKFLTQGFGATEHGHLEIPARDDDAIEGRGPAAAAAA